MDLGKHIAFYHLELAQLWRCSVMALPSYVVYSMEAAKSGQILSGVDSFKSGVVENADAMRLRRGDWYVVVQPRRLASLSPIPVDQPYRKSHGVPGYVPKASVVIHRGNGFSEKTPGPPWAYPESIC